MFIAGRNKDVASPLHFEQLKYLSLRGLDYFI